jgi:ribosomal protein S18 acetylase RimI-like enzyme
MKLFEILNTSIQYRSPTAHDAEKIVDLKTQLYMQNGDNMPTPPRLEGEHTNINVLTSKNNFYKIVVNGEDIVGYCSMKEYKPSEGIFGIGILNSYSGHGIGKALMTDLISHTKLHGIDSLDCYVGKTNAPAIELYKKFGFAITGKEGNNFIMKLSFNNRLTGLK